MHMRGELHATTQTQELLVPDVRIIEHAKSLVLLLPNTPIQ